MSIVSFEEADIVPTVEHLQLIIGHLHRLHDPIKIINRDLLLLHILIDSLLELAEKFIGSN